MSNLDTVQDIYDANYVEAMAKHHAAEDLGRRRARDEIRSKMIQTLSDILVVSQVLGSKIKKTEVLEQLKSAGIGVDEELFRNASEDQILADIHQELASLNAMTNRTILINTKISNPT